MHSRAPSCVVSPRSVPRVWPRTLIQLRVGRSAGDSSIGSPSSYVSMVASQTQRRRTRRRKRRRTETQNGDANVSKFPKFQVFREEAGGRSVSSTVSAGVRRGGTFGLWPLWMLLRCMVTHTSWAVPSCAADVVQSRTCMDVVAHTLHALCCNRTHGGDVVLMARC